jgi:hypothetical protein
MAQINIHPTVLSAIAPEALEAVDGIIQNLNSQWQGDIEFPKNYFFLERFGPGLFLDVFPSLTVEDIRPLMVSIKLMGTSLVICDWITDRTNESFLATKYELSCLAMQLEAYQIWHSLFPPASKFWERFRTTSVEFCHKTLHFSLHFSGPE